MNKNLQQLFFLLLGFLIANPVAAQVKVYASIHPQQIKKNEYATYRMVIENGSQISNVKLPKFNNFNVISGPAEESGASYTNGKMASYLALSFTLQPKKTGTLSVPPASVSVQGKEMHSNAVQLKVTPGNGSSTAPQTTLPVFQNPFSGINPLDIPTAAKPDFKDYILHPNENIVDKVQQNMHLKLELNKTSCYVGESILASYVLYSRLRSESRLIKNPAFNGFSVIDLPVQEQALGIGMLNGRKFNKYEIRKAQLYPLMAGEVTFDEATLENNIQFIKAEATANGSGQVDWFDGLFNDPNAVVMQKINLSSKPVTITVKPLPSQGKPASFKGAVGNFMVDALLQNDRFTTDEMGQLTVTIRGDGNLQLITAPEINWGKNIEAFDPILAEQLNDQTVPVSGYKSFTFNFNVLEAKEYTIPGIAFSYFDPQTATYKTANTQAIHFTVSKGTGTSQNNKVPVVENEQKETLLNKLLHNKMIWASAGAILLLSIWVFTQKKKPAKTTKIAAQEAEPEPLLAIEKKVDAAAVCQQNALQKTKEYLHYKDGKRFYEVLNGEMKTYLSKRLQIPVTALSAKTISEKMDENGFPNSTCVGLENLLQQIEWFIYTPSQSEDHRNQLYEKAHEIIQEINAHYINLTNR